MPIFLPFTLTASHIGQRLRIDNTTTKTIAIGNPAEAWTPGCVIEVVNISSTNSDITFSSEPNGVNFFNGAIIKYGEYARMTYNGNDTWDMHIYKTVPVAGLDGEQGPPGPAGPVGPAGPAGSGGGGTISSVNSYLTNEGDLLTKAFLPTVDYDKYFLAVNTLNEEDTLTDDVPRVITNADSLVNAGDVLAWTPLTNTWETIASLPKASGDALTFIDYLTLATLPVAPGWGSIYNVSDPEESSKAWYMWDGTEYVAFGTLNAVIEAYSVPYFDPELVNSFSEMPVPGEIGKVWIAQPETTDTFTSPDHNFEDNIEPGGIYVWDGIRYEAVEYTSHTENYVSIRVARTYAGAIVEEGDTFNGTAIQCSIVIPERLNVIGNVNVNGKSKQVLPSLFRLQHTFSLTSGSSSDWFANLLPGNATFTPNITFDNYAGAFTVVAGGVYKMTVNAKISPYNSSQGDADWPEEEVAFGFELSGQMATFGFNDSYFTRSRPNGTVSNDADKVITAVTEVVFQVRDNGFLQLYAFVNSYASSVSYADIDAFVTFTRLYDTAQVPDPV